MFSYDGCLFVNACRTSSVTFCSFYEKNGVSAIENWFLAAGTQNKALQSYKQDASRPGVSYVKITQSKLVCALGDILRVYSFDYCD